VVINEGIELAKVFGATDGINCQRRVDKLALQLQVDEVGPQALSPSWVSSS
jgi:hypothetical protein